MLFKVGCDAGTYIRTLCVDIGNSLGCGAHLTELRRTRSGCFSESNIALAMFQDIETAARASVEHGDASALKNLILPMERAFDEFPRIIIDDRAIKATCRGIGIKAGDVLAIDSEVQDGSNVAIFTMAGEIIARGRSLLTATSILESHSGFMARISKVYASSSTRARYQR